jgi:hypothetical protein
MPKASDTAKKDGEQSTESGSGFFGWGRQDDTQKDKSTEQDSGSGLFGWSWGSKKEPEKPAGGAFNSFMKPAQPTTTPSSTGFTFNNPNPPPEKSTNAQPEKDWFSSTNNGDKSKSDDPVSPMTQADIQRAGSPKPSGGNNGKEGNNPTASRDKEASLPTQTPSAKALGKRPQGAPEGTATPPSQPSPPKGNTERADGTPPASNGGEKDDSLRFFQTDGAAPPPEKSNPEPSKGPDQPSWSFGSFGAASASASSSQPRPQPQPNQDPQGKDASNTNATENPKDTPAPPGQNRESSSNPNGADGRPPPSPSPSPSTNPADALLLVHGIPISEESKIKTLADLEKYKLTPEDQQY